MNEFNFDAQKFADWCEERFPKMMGKCRSKELVIALAKNMVEKSNTIEDFIDGMMDIIPSQVTEEDYRRFITTKKQGD